MPENLPDFLVQALGSNDVPVWIQRALRKEGKEDMRTGQLETVKTIDFGSDNGFFVAPTIRKFGEEIHNIPQDIAVEMAMFLGDSVGPFKTQEEATGFSKQLSGFLDTIK